MFQSPSRGGHLRGVRAGRGAFIAGPFQSPSRGGHLRGRWKKLLNPSRNSVSVPFTRGTPPWLQEITLLIIEPVSFSPLHEGDTSVASNVRRFVCRGRYVSVPFTRGTPPWPIPSRPSLSRSWCFSPLHEGDTSVASRTQPTSTRCTRFQSPSRGGHLRGAQHLGDHRPLVVVSVPFTRGTPPWRLPISSRHGDAHGVSVPFTRGTPPWPRLRSYQDAGLIAFQSPSRGGHLRGIHQHGALPDTIQRFSPLHEGDTSVAVRADAAGEGGSEFQSPSRGGHLRGEGTGRVAVPEITGFSPLHEGDTSVAPSVSVET